MQITNLMIDQYLHAALWATACNAGDSTSEAGNYDIDDVSDSFRERSTADLTAFLESAGELLDNLDPCQVGHDFWLTRCGHGTGFWDRGLGDIGDKLTEIATSCGNVDLYVGADSLVYGS